MKIVTNFIFLGSKITAHDDCSHEIKKRLLLGRKAMIKSYDRQHIEKQRQYFANTHSSSQSYGFSSSQVWMWELDHKEGCCCCLAAESWLTLCNPIVCSQPGSSFHGILQIRTLEWVAISFSKKKAEHRRIDAFEFWCWRRLLRVPWTARRSNQSIPKEISSEYSLEGLILKLKLQNFGHLMRRTDSLEKTLMLGKIEGGRLRGRQDEMASLTWWTWVWVGSGSWWWTGRPGVLQ